MVTTCLTFVVVCLVTLLPVGAEVQSNVATVAVTAFVKEDYGDTRYRDASARHGARRLAGENMLLLRRETEESSVFRLAQGRANEAQKGLQPLQHSESHVKSPEDHHVRQPEMKTSQAEHHEHTMHQIRRACWHVHTKALLCFSQLQMVVVRGSEMTLQQWKNIAIASAGTLLLLVICISWRAMCGRSPDQSESGHNSSVGPPDFEIQEASGKCSRLVKWCTEEECTEMGIKIKPPPAEFEDYSQHDFGRTLSVQAVETLLLKCRVNFEIFDAGRYLPSITMKLLRTECYFMIHNELSKILLMSEGVQVFLNHDGYWLLEEASENTWLAGIAGSSMNLPSIDKTGGESPVSAAKRIWTDDLSMPAHLVRFIEYGADLKEVHTYEGLKCMERNYYVIITLNKRLEAKDNEALHGLNIVSKSSFQSKRGKQMKWVSQSEVDGMEALRTVCPPQNVADDCYVRRKSITRNELDASLRTHGINSEVWDGTRGMGTAKDLFNEVSKGISTLQLTPSGMNRVLSVVLVRLWDSKQERLLVELGRIYYKDDEIQTCKPQLPGTRQFAHETVAETAQRVVTSQFSLYEDDVHISSEANWEYMEKVSDSEKFPGMNSKYQMCFANVQLADDTRLPGPINPR